MNTYVFSYLRGNITAKYWSKPISRVPTIDALETQDDTNSLKRHRIGWFKLVCILGHNPNGMISKHIKGIKIKVEMRFTTNRFPTNLKEKKKKFFCIVSLDIYMMMMQLGYPPGLQYYGKVHLMIWYRLV